MSCSGDVQKVRTHTSMTLLGEVWAEAAFGTHRRISCGGSKTAKGRPWRLPTFKVQWEENEFSEEKGEMIRGEENGKNLRDYRVSRGSYRATYEMQQ